MVYFAKVAKKGEKTPKNTPKKFFKKILKICRDEKIPFFRILKFRPLKKVFEFSLKKIRIPPKLPVDLKTSFSKRSKKFWKWGCLGGIDTQKRPLYNTPTVNGWHPSHRGSAKTKSFWGRCYETIFEYVVNGISQYVCTTVPVEPSSSIGTVFLLPIYLYLLWGFLSYHEAEYIIPTILRPAKVGWGGYVFHRK